MKDRETGQLLVAKRQHADYNESNRYNRHSRGTRRNGLLRDEQRNNAILVVILTIIPAVGWGLVFLVMDILLDSLAPLQILASRWMLAAVTILILAALRVFPLQFSKENIGYLFLIGIVQAVLYPLLEIFGLSLTSASILSIFESLVPSFTVILGALFFHKKTDRQGVLSILVVIAGVVICTVFAPDFSAEGKILGYFLVLVSVIDSALYSQMVAKAGGTVNALTITTALCLTGAVMHNGIVFAQGDGFETYRLLLSNWPLLGAIAFLSIGSSILCFTAYNKAMALARNPGLAANISGGLATVVGAAAGIFIRHDTAGLYTVIGMIVILAGVALSTRKV